MKKPCVLCDSPEAEIGPLRNSDAVAIYCATCGRYILTLDAAEVLSQTDFKAKRYVLSSLTRAASDAGNRLELTAYTVGDLLESARLPRTPFDVLDRLMVMIHDGMQSLSDVVFIPFTDYPLIQATSREDLATFINHLVDLGYVKTRQAKDGFRCVLKLKGWERLADIRTSGQLSNRAFVAMSFVPTLDGAWTDGFAPALSDAGYSPVRIDLVEHNEKICDRIVSEIRRSGLLVADFTGNRGGVYYEAGLAEGLSLPVIFCVRDTDLEAVHFDTRQYNHIVWADPQDLRKQLFDRVTATVGLSRP